MLKKLFAHEWIDTWKVPALLNVVVVCLTLLGVLVLHDDIWNRADSNILVSCTLLIYMMAYFGSVFALCLVTNFYFWFRFYKNLYADPGYLMHTLPVTPNQLIWSKFFVNAIWSVISTVVSVISFVTVVNVLSNGTLFENFSIFDIIDAFSRFEPDEIGKFILVVFLLLLMVLGSFVMSVFMGYAAVSIGQLFKKHRIGGAILMYFALYMAFQTLTSFAMIPIQYLILEPSNSFWSFIGVLVIMVVLSCGGAIAFYLITHHIMSNKLNLE